MIVGQENNNVVLQAPYQEILSYLAMIGCGP